MESSKYHYYMFYKPFGCVSARRDSRYPTVMDHFKIWIIQTCPPSDALTGRLKDCLSLQMTDNGIN